MGLAERPWGSVADSLRVIFRTRALGIVNQREAFGPTLEKSPDPRPPFAATALIRVVVAGSAKA
jgi:hypothetical protein